MKYHDLKIERRWLERIHDGSKTSELRVNDRDFQVGDIIQFTVDGDIYSEREYKVTHVLTSDVCQGLELSYCILSVVEVLKEPIT